MSAYLSDFYLQQAINIYQKDITLNDFKSYTTQQYIINSGYLPPNLQDNTLINFYALDSLGNRISPSQNVLTLKTNGGILINKIPGKPPARNYLVFNDDHPYYSGKAIAKVRYNSTIGNGYESINLTNQSTIFNPAIIRPKTRRLETFYDINVPSGASGIRYLIFQPPSSFPFVQGTCMNLKFNFAANNNPCIISGLSLDGNHIFSLTGANYNFIQKERVILVSQGQNGSTYEFKHW